MNKELDIFEEMEKEFAILEKHLDGLGIALAELSIDMEVLASEVDKLKRERNDKPEHN